MSYRINENVTENRCFNVDVVGSLHFRPRSLPICKMRAEVERRSPLLVHAQHVRPEIHRAFELEGVDQCEHQHGVHDHRHPEVLQHPAPPLVVHLGGNTVQISISQSGLYVSLSAVMSQIKTGSKRTSGSEHHFYAEVIKQSETHCGL